MWSRPISVTDFIAPRALEKGSLRLRPVGSVHRRREGKHWKLSVKATVLPGSLPIGAYGSYDLNSALLDPAESGYLKHRLQLKENNSAFVPGLRPGRCNNFLLTALEGLVLRGYSAKGWGS